MSRTLLKQCVQTAQRQRLAINASHSTVRGVPTVLSRTFSKFIDIDDDLDNWPKQKSNTIFNVCPQGQEMVVERLGKLCDVKSGGYFFAIPLIDSIGYIVDMREKAITISPQSCITKDNVHVEVSGALYCQFTDATKAAYGSKNPIYAMKQHAQSSMRAAIGKVILSSSTGNACWKMEDVLPSRDNSYLLQKGPWFWNTFSTLHSSHPITNVYFLW